MFYLTEDGQRAEEPDRVDSCVAHEHQGYLFH